MSVIENALKKKRCPRAVGAGLASTLAEDWFQFLRVAFERLHCPGERDFLMQPRSLNREDARLRRIMSEFEQWAPRLHKLVGGHSIRLGARQARYRTMNLSRKVGRKLAEVVWRSLPRRAGSWKLRTGSA